MYTGNVTQVPKDDPLLVALVQCYMTKATWNMKNTVLLLIQSPHRPTWKIYIVATLLAPHFPYFRPKTIGPAYIESRASYAGDTSLQCLVQQKARHLQKNLNQLEKTKET